MQQKLRFKRKPYGRGRVPVTRQGWVSIAVYMLGIFSCVVWVDQPSYAACSSSQFMIFVPIVLWTAGLIALCYKTGEKPRWQRGEKKSG